PPSATLEDQEAMRRALGLDRSIAEQYVIWLGNALQGDLGNSIQFREGVLSLIGKTLPATIELALLALVMAGTLGIVGGLTIFHLRGTRAEPAADLGVTIMMSVPDFLWGIFLILAFGVAWTLLPFTGRVGAGM